MDHPELTKKEARQGETLGAMRYVLAISTVAGFIAMGVAAYLIFA